MKLKIYVVFFLIFFILKANYAQDRCKVLMESIQGNYSGECKKGLANGEGVAKGIDEYTGHFKKGLPDGSGTYVWSSGAVYQGHWKRGKREGMGTYFFKVDGRDSVLTGVWNKDEYMGKKKINPSVSLYKNIDQYTIRQTAGIQPRVMFYFQQNGMQNTRVENMMLNANSGTVVQVGQKFGFDNVVFPITLSVRYDTYNKLGTQQINCVIELTIYEEGDWEVILKN